MQINLLTNNACQVDSLKKSASLLTAYLYLFEKNVFDLIGWLYFLSRFDKGAHLYLRSYVMRTHGARQQKQAIKKAPRKTMQTVFEVLYLL